MIDSPGAPAIDLKEFDAVTRGKKLGAGSFGQVFVGLLPSGRFVAIKQLPLSDEAEASTAEVEVHKRLHHPHIIRYLHSVVDRSGPPQLLLFLEFVTGGSITSVMKTLPDGKFPPVVARVYARHLFLGLEYLHDHGVAHRDIKGDNILISQDTGLAKLADFDQAKVVQQTINRKTASKSLAGTPAWMAPEVIMADVYNPFKADIWSAGCAVAEMLTGRPPWLPMANPMALMMKLTNSTGWPDAIPRDAAALGGSDAIDFLDRCFIREPSQRPDCGDLLQHAFLRGGVTLS